MLWMLPLKRYFRFSGRSGRAEFWQFMAVLMAANAVVMLLEAATTSGYGSGTGTLTYLLGLATIVPSYAVTFRRLHDRNRSGWLVGALFMFNGIFYAAESIRADIESVVLASPFALIGWITVAATCSLAIYILVQACLPGDPEPNRYGPPPQFDDAAEEAALRTSVAAAGERVRAASAPSVTGNPVEQLERLSRLHATGALTTAEFEAQKTALLRRL